MKSNGKPENTEQIAEMSDGFDITTLVDDQEQERLIHHHTSKIHGALGEIVTSSRELLKLGLDTTEWARHVPATLSVSYLGFKPMTAPERRKIAPVLSRNDSVEPA